jgi:hypothetical protein
MQDFGPQDNFDEQTRVRRALVAELIRDASAEMARMRESTAALEAQDSNEWERARRSAHNIAARAQALDLGILASCARELERFAGLVIAGGLQRQPAALQNAAIAIETIDLELAVLSKSDRPA